jgi:hypothetical protein
MIRRVLFSCLVASSFGVGNAWAHHTVPGRMHPVMTTVNITQPVLAGGQPLAPGRYELIVTDESPAREAGQANESQRWVEFVRNGMVVARELAEVFPHAETPVGTSSPPHRAGVRGGGPGVESGAPRAVVQKLKADDFVRVSVNASNARYLVYLPLSQP